MIAALACPMLVEVFADPVDVSDSQGEFVEVRLPDEAAGCAERAGCGTGGADFDSLFVQFEEKSALKFPFPAGGRFVLVHDSESCPRMDGVACGLLGSISLPNSRETFWRTWVGRRDGSLTCLDSVSLPSPKAGASFQRVKETERWEPTVPTMGEANPLFELGVKDCGLELFSANLLNEGAAILNSAESAEWNLKFSMTGCDSSRIRYEVEDLFGRNAWIDSAGISGTFLVDGVKGKALRVFASLPRDEASKNDIVDTLLVLPGSSPVIVSEVHHCPQEPEPEWVEVYNRTGRSLPLQKFRFCDRGGVWGKSATDSIAPYQSVIFTKDTAGLRGVLGYGDVCLVQLSLGYLNNTSGSISVCYGDAVLDSVAWDKSTVSCPLGFSPISGKAEYTPGFQRPAQRGSPQRNDVPFAYKLSSRMVRRNGSLRVYVESESPVEVKLLDSAGHVQWTHVAPARSNAWWNIPLKNLSKTGVAFISLKSGRYENLVGFILRP